jgi:hypothetical protein
MQSERSTNPSANECANNPNDDVDENSEAAPVDYPASECAGKATNNQPEDDSMRDRVYSILPGPPRWRPTRYRCENVDCAGNLIGSRRNRHICADTD